MHSDAFPSLVCVAHLNDIIYALGLDGVDAVVFYRPDHFVDAPLVVAISAM